MLSSRKYKPFLAFVMICLKKYIINVLYYFVKMKYSNVEIKDLFDNFKNIHDANKLQNNN